MKNHYYNINLTGTEDRRPVRVKSAFLPLLLALAIITLPLKKAVAQSAPTLSYSSPQVYLPNTVITPLSPTSSGVATPAYSTTPVTINTSLSSPFGVATDAAGNLYVSDLATKIVKEFPVGGGTPVIIGSGEFSHPEGITVDAAGNVYAAGDYNGMVTEILKSDGSAVNSGTGFNEFSGVAVDAAGNIYVADFGSNNPVKEILKSNGSTVPIGTGFSNYCIAVATDATGNVYVADTHNAIKEILASNGSTIDLGSGFSNPQGVAVDALGNVFVSDQGNGAIKEIPVGSNTPVTLVSGLTNPGQIAVDGAGNIYFVDTTTGTVQEIKPLGGYYINALPPGLSFSNSSGVISGTTVGNVPPTNYTVTAYNANGSATAVINITVGTPPAPTLSYASPVTYTTNQVITSLVPQSSAVAQFGYNSAPILVGSGYNNNQGIATDAAGNVYVSDFYNKAVKEIPANGGPQVTIATGLNGPIGITLDRAATTLYVAESSSNDIKKIPLNGDSPTILGTGLNTPTGVAVDAAGNIYVADYLNNAIKKISATDGSTTSVGSGYSYPFAIAIDEAGNLYIADVYNNEIKKIQGGNGTISVIGTGFSSPEAVAVDATGNVYVTDFDHKAVKVITVGDGSTSTIAGGFVYPQGIAVDGAGNVFVDDTGPDKVLKFAPVGGYFINSALPAGLSFSNSSGIVSGTPTTVSAAKNYTVTAYNITGSANATVNLNVVAPVTITSITRQYAALTNTYYAAYNVVFSGPVTGLTPSNFSVTATNGITGTSVNSVSGSGNTFSVVVFTGTGNGTVTLNLDNDLGMEPGVSTALPFAGDTYTIDKTPPSASPLVFSSNNANPAIAYIGNTVSLVFGSSKTIQAPVVTIAGHNVTAVSTGTNAYKASYTITAGDTYGRVHFTLAMTDLAGNTSSYDDVTAGDDVEFVSQNASTSNAGLSVTLSTGSLLTFVSNLHNVKTYTTSVTHGTASMMVTPTATDPSASITVDGHSVKSGANSQPIALNSDTTTISVSITAADGVTRQTYAILVSQGASSNAGLSVALSTGSLLTFVSNLQNIKTYTTSVASGTTSLTVTSTASDPSARITVDGQPVQSGAKSQQIALHSDTTTISVSITAADGVTRRTYAILVSQGASSNAGLSVTLSTGSLLTFVSNLQNIKSYTTSVANGTATLTVTPIASDPSASITVDGQPVQSGAKSQQIALNSDTTTISVSITAADGVTRRTYAILVSQGASSNAGLSVMLSTHSLLTFVSNLQNIKTYTASVKHGTASLTVIPTASDTSASITVDGQPVQSGANSQLIALNSDTTTISVSITAADGVTRRTYAILVSQDAATINSDNTLSLINLSNSGPQIAGDEIKVHNAVSPNGDGVNDVLVIEGIAAYPDNKLTIINRSGNVLYEVSGYDNVTKVFDGHSSKTRAMQQAGTYFYMLQYKVNGDTKSKTGYIVLKY